jgi:hypothetical protein
MAFAPLAVQPDEVANAILERTQPRAAANLKAGPVNLAPGNSF